MKILAVGGGSGGHVTPVLAVLNELAKHDEELVAYFICDQGFGDQAVDIMKSAVVPVETRRVLAGKLRRYHGVSLIKQLLDVPTTLRNVRDVFFIAIGFLQSAVLIAKWRPDVVFTKGGFVCLPAGLAAAIFRIPLVIHDSDAHPGLTNRVLARFATKIATGAPLENYPYPHSKTTYVGIPVDSSFRPYTPEEQRRAKERLELPDTEKPLVVVTGGGLGARRINHATSRIAEQLIADTAIVHVTGAGQYEETVRQAPELAEYKIVPFVASGMADVIGAAEIVVTRAGATTLLELAAAAKPAIIIPNGMLTGGHQLKNAAVYAEAAVVLDEASVDHDPGVLEDAIRTLLKNPARRQELGQTLHTFAKPDAAVDTVELIVAAHKG